MNRISKSMHCGLFFLGLARFSLVVVFFIQIVSTYRFPQSGKIFPIFHNLQLKHSSDFLEIIKNRHSCVISYDDLESESCLSKICEIQRHCQIGAYVSSMEQIKKVKEAGALFIQTNHVDKDISALSKKFNLPVMCGVSSLSTCEQAIQLNSAALQFTPDTTLGIEHFAQILKCLHSSFPYDDLPIFIAGGVSSQDFEKYLAVDDSLNFIVNLDFSKMTASQMEPKLTAMESSLKEISLRLRIERDLKNSCL